MLVFLNQGVTATDNLKLKPLSMKPLIFPTRVTSLVLATAALAGSAAAAGFAPGHLAVLRAAAAVEQLLGFDAVAPC